MMAITTSNSTSVNALHLAYSLWGEPIFTSPYCPALSTPRLPHNFKSFPPPEKKQPCRRQGRHQQRTGFGNRAPQAAARAGTAGSEITTPRVVLGRADRA